MPGLAVDGRLIFTGEQFIDTANTLEIDDWVRLDLGVRYVVSAGDVPLTLRARLDNVTDEAYWASTGGFPRANYLIQGEPRTLSIRLSADF